MIVPLNNSHSCQIVYPANSLGERFVGFFLGVTTCIFMLFPYVSFGAVGLPVISFLFIGLFAFWGVMTRPRSRFKKRLIWVFSAYLMFVAIYGLMFLLSGSTTGMDIHFVVSAATNVFWVVFLVIIAEKSPAIFRNTSKIFVYSFSLFLLVVWFFGACQSSDPFFLRHAGFESHFLNLSVFRNPNVLARSSATLLPLLYFSYIVSVMRGRRNHLVVALMLGVVFVVLSTLSRANFLTVFIFFVGAISYRRVVLQRAVNIQWKRATVLVLVFGLLLIAIVPILQKRVMSLQDMVVKTWDIAIEGDKGLVPKRIRTWVATFKVIRENPFVGVGYSNIDKYQEKYGATTFQANGVNPPMAVHGGFLKIAAYGGLTSLAVFLFFYFLYFRMARQIFCEALPLSSQQSASYSLCLLLLLLVPMNIGADNFGLSLTWLVLGFLTGFMSITPVENTS